MMDRFGYGRERLSSRYLDPTDDFRPRELTLEVRRDPIAGVTSRILPHRFRSPGKPDIQTWNGKSPTAACPFCPERFDRLTPRFPPEVAPGGRFVRGEACLFPNAFPHDGHNGIVRFSARHLVGIDELTPSYLHDGFLVCPAYFQRLRELDPALRFCSINWNYMPPAGGGLIHPHLQTIAGAHPSRFMERLRRSALFHRERHGCNLWEDLLLRERDRGERYIGATGEWEWLSAFAPRGMAGEIAFFLPRRRGIFDLTETDFSTLFEGFARIFRFLGERGFASFNASLYASLAPDDLLRVQGRLLPRFHLLPLETSDVNYFDKCHGEVICPVIPEDLCRDLSPFFRKHPS